MLILQMGILVAMKHKDSRRRARATVAKDLKAKKTMTKVAKIK